MKNRAKTASFWHVFRFGLFFILKELALKRRCSSLKKKKIKKGFSPALLQSVAGEENHKKKKKKIGDQSASVDRINAPKQHLREGVQARHQRVTSHRLEPRHTFRNYAFQYSLGALCCN